MTSRVENLLHKARSYLIQARFDNTTKRDEVLRDFVGEALTAVNDGLAHERAKHPQKIKLATLTVRNPRPHREKSPAYVYQKVRKAAESELDNNLAIRAHYG